MYLLALAQAVDYVVYALAEVYGFMTYVPRVLLEHLGYATRSRHNMTPLKRGVVALVYTLPLGYLLALTASLCACPQLQEQPRCGVPYAARDAQCTLYMLARGWPLAHVVACIIAHVGVIVWSGLWVVCIMEIATS